MLSALRLRLAGMMFFEYAAWGAWMPILSGTLNDRHVPALYIGYVYGAFWLGNLISPFVGGQLADRKLASQHFIAICNLLAAVAAFWMSVQTDKLMLVIGMFIWSLFFTPCLGITNSITLQQIDKEKIHQGTKLTESERERVFSILRMCGTAGWIVAAFILYGFSLLIHSNVQGYHGPIPEMMLCGIYCVVMALYSLTLPNTPPNKDLKNDPMAFREAFGLFRSVPGFSIFMFISFFAATEFMFFYNLSAQFLESLNIQHIWVPIDKSISQIMEVVALGVLLPLWLPKKGMRWCLLVGSFAWPLRYVIFAIGKPVWLVVLSLALHGFGYAFVIIVQQLYMDRVSPKDIRGSAQSLLNIITLGAGNVAGSILCGVVQGHFTVNGQVNWVPVFLIPAVTTLACAFAYMYTFRDSDVQKAALLQEQAAG